MDTINNILMSACDKESKIYCKSFNSFQESLKTIDANVDGMSELDLSSLGLYLCKCVEQEINSTIIQLIRYYLGIDMPDFYCRIDRSFDRYGASIDTGRNGIRHLVFVNDYKDVLHRNILKTIPLGDAYEALYTLLEEDPDWFSNYPMLTDSRFKETWRSIAKLRNEMAHAGTVCKRESLIDCYNYCRSFLEDFMPRLAEIKDDLAPDGWAEESICIDIEPAVQEPSKLEALLSKFKADQGKPKAGLDNYVFYQSLISERDKARKDNNDEEELRYNIHISDYVRQFDWQEIPFEDSGKLGIMDITGTLVIPAMYDDFLFLQSILDNHFKVTIAKKNGYYGLVERYSGKALTDFKYDRISLVVFQFSLFFFSIDGSKSLGLIDCSGIEVIPCIIDRVDCFTCGLVFQSGDKYGYYSYWYTLYVPPIYDDIIVIDLNEPFIFIINGVEGCISKTGKFYTKDHLNNMEEDDSLEYVEKWDLLMEREGE